MYLFCFSNCHFVFFSVFLSTYRSKQRACVCATIHSHSHPFVYLCMLFECLLFAVYDYCQLLLFFYCLSIQSLSFSLACFFFSFAFFSYIFVTLYNTNEFSIFSKNVCVCVCMYRSHFIRLHNLFPFLLFRYK